MALGAPGVGCGGCEGQEQECEGAHGNWREDTRTGKRMGHAVLVQTIQDSWSKDTLFVLPESERFLAIVKAQNRACQA